MESMVVMRLKLKWRRCELCRWSLNRFGVDGIKSILTQALLEDSPRRNILDMELICIKMAWIAVMKTQFMHWKEIWCNSRIWWILALECKIHSVIAIYGQVSHLATDLALWTSIFSLMILILWLMLWWEIVVVESRIVTTVALWVRCVVVWSTTASTDIVIVPSSSSCRSLIQIHIGLWIASIAIWLWVGGKHCKGMWNRIWIHHHCLFFTLQHNWELLIGNRITSSMNCRTKFCKFFT